MTYLQKREKRFPCRDWSSKPWLCSKVIMQQYLYLCSLCSGTMETREKFNWVAAIDSHVNQQKNSSDGILASLMKTVSWWRQLAIIWMETNNTNSKRDHKYDKCWLDLQDNAEWRIIYMRVVIGAVLQTFELKQVLLKRYAWLDCRVIDHCHHQDHHHEANCNPP